MIDKFIFSSKNIMPIIEKKMVYMEDIGLTKWDLLAITVEFLEYSKHNLDFKTPKDYLDDMWLLNDNIVPKVTFFIEDVISELKIFCPDVISVLSKTDGLKIVYYDKHMFMLERTPFKIN